MTSAIGFLQQLSRMAREGIQRHEVFVVFASFRKVGFISVISSFPNRRLL
jgi:hypothetical protein